MLPAGRSALASMDVPARQSYTMAVVEPAERTATAGVTSLARGVAQVPGPAIAGALPRAARPGRAARRNGRAEDRLRPAVVRAVPGRPAPEEVASADPPTYRSAAAELKTQAVSRLASPGRSRCTSRVRRVGGRDRDVGQTGVTQSRLVLGESTARRRCSPRRSHARPARSAVRASSATMSAHADPATRARARERSRANTACLSAARLMTQLLITTSTDAAGSGTASISPSGTRRCPLQPRPRCAAPGRASRRSCPGRRRGRSGHTARRQQDVDPPPEPRSSTRSPSRSSATATGLPQPSEASTAASGSSALLRLAVQGKVARRVGWPCSTRRRSRTPARAATGSTGRGPGARRGRSDRAPPRGSIGCLVHLEIVSLRGYCRSHVGERHTSAISMLVNIDIRRYSRLESASMDQIRSSRHDVCCRRSPIPFACASFASWPQVGPVCACDIAAGYQVSQPTVSHHLRVLREAGWVDG